MSRSTLLPLLGLAGIVIFGATRAGGADPVVERPPVELVAPPPVVDAAPAVAPPPAPPPAPRLRSEVEEAAEVVADTAADAVRVGPDSTVLGARPLNEGLETPAAE